VPLLSPTGPSTGKKSFTTRLWHLQERDRSLRGKRQAARLKFVNANTPDFNPENEGSHPKKILDYIHAKDGNGKVV
jgi:hypothetical protein